MNQPKEITRMDLIRAIRRAKGSITVVDTGESCQGFYQAKDLGELCRMLHSFIASLDEDEALRTPDGRPFSAWFFASYEKYKRLEKAEGN